MQSTYIFQLMLTIIAVISLHAAQSRVYCKLSLGEKFVYLGEKETLVCLHQYWTLLSYPNTVVCGPSHHWSLVQQPWGAGSCPPCLLMHLCRREAGREEAGREGEREGGREGGRGKGRGEREGGRGEREGGREGKRGRKRNREGECE